MFDFKVGDIVVRKSYGGDIPFVINKITKDENNDFVYHLSGLIYRIEADSKGDDLLKQDPKKVQADNDRYMYRVSRYANMRMQPRGIFSFRFSRGTPGKVLQIDSSEDYLDRCLQHYKDGGLSPVGEVYSESEQPSIVQNLLKKYKPDILVLTGHDSIKKNADKYNLNSYSNSRYYIQSVKEARKYESSSSKLCIFAGACQSYYEALMSAGANFASSPGRILINALDPAIVAEKVALTDSSRIVTPREVAAITITGSKGIGGINTRGHRRR